MIFFQVKTKIKTLTVHIFFNLQNHPHFPLRGKIGQLVRGRECFVGLSTMSRQRSHWDRSRSRHTWQTVRILIPPHLSDIAKKMYYPDSDTLFTPISGQRHPLYTNIRIATPAFHQYPDSDTLFPPISGQRHPLCTNIRIATPSLHQYSNTIL